MSGVFGQRFAAKIFAHLGLRQFGKIFDELLLRISPGEIGVALVETGFGQRFHHLWPGERFGEKDCVGIFLADACDQILPERDRLGVRIIHAKDAHPALGPKQTRCSSSPPRVRASSRTENSADKCLRISSADSPRI